MDSDDRRYAFNELSPVGRPMKRLNADIELDLHRWFKRFAFQSEAQMSDVMRVLIAELRDDGALATKVRGRLTQAAKLREVVNRDRAGKGGCA